MVDLRILEKHGITQESLKAKLFVDPLHPPQGTEDEKRIAAMLFRIRSRVQEGMQRNFADYKTYYAIDLMWDTPFRQINPSLVQTFLSSDPNQEAVYKQVQDWGMSSLIEEKNDPKTNKAIKTFNFPTFFQVFVPLVKAYVTIRWAKIVNDRRQTPFFKYDPIKVTTPLRVKCEAITDRVQIIANQYGYFDVLKQSVLKMLMYSVSIMFPKEEWHKEMTWKSADALDVAFEKKNEAGKTVELGEEIKVVSREGIRPHLPHPSRTYRDIAHPAHTINTDSGCEFGGYWRVARYREISTNEAFWNREKIALGTVDFINGNRTFFSSVYSACTLQIPVATPSKQTEGAANVASMGLGAGDLDREKQLANLYYGTEHGDQGVMVSEHFEKLIPKDNGLGDYDCPVWFRFVVAGDLCTILYCAPMAYPPMLYAAYDADESRIKNASMAQEIAPFQDQFSNVLTQVLLTAKQNLANLTFVDEDQLSAAAISKIENIGEGYYRFLNVLGYSSKKAARLQNKLPEAAFPINFPKGSVQELITVLKSVLDILERVLVMSSNEVGQAASHEQTREEIRNIAASTSSRLTFTATPVDIMIDAWKRQLYYGLMANGDDDFYVRIPAEIPFTKEVLQQMGFTYVDNDEDDRHRMAMTDKASTAINIWELASNRDGEDRANDAQSAQVLASLVQPLITNPLTAPAIGAQQALDIANMIAQLAGAPRDFKLRDMTPQVSPEQQQAEAQQQLKQVIDTVLAQVTNELQPLVKATEEHSHEIAMLFKALNLRLPEPQDPNANPNQTIDAAGGGPAGAANVPPVQNVPAAVAAPG